MSSMVIKKSCESRAMRSATILFQLPGPESMEPRPTENRMIHTVDRCTGGSRINESMFLRKVHCASHDFVSHDFLITQNDFMICAIFITFHFRFRKEIQGREGRPGHRPARTRKWANGPVKSAPSHFKPLKVKTFMMDIPIQNDSNDFNC